MNNFNCVLDLFIIILSFDRLASSPVFCFYHLLSFSNFFGIHVISARLLLILLIIVCALACLNFFPLHLMLVRTFCNIVTVNLVLVTTIYLAMSYN